MDELLQEQQNNSAPERLRPYQFKKGQSGNPAGRPPGKSLKERAKAMLNAMTPEEEQEFLEGIDKKTIWEMAEGKAKSEDSLLIGELPKPITDVIRKDNSISEDKPTI